MIMIKFDSGEEFECAAIMTDTRTFSQHRVKKHSLQPVQFSKGKPKNVLDEGREISSKEGDISY